MDLLTRRRSTPLSGLRRCLAFVALLLGVAACLGRGPDRPKTFPHDVHVREKGLACTFCHVTARTADLPSLPPPELCAPCHDKKDPEAPFAQWTATWFGDGGRFRRASTPQLAADVVFRHGDHTGKARLDCLRCHQDVADEQAVPAAMPDWKRTCMECHEKSGKDVRDCRSCHTQIDRETLPSTHFHAWDVRHGEVVRSGDDASPNRCDLCHEAGNSCTTCHQTNPPRNHDNLFRTRTHGVLASFDRSRCFQCHRTDSCEECHQQTRPVSHRGGFGDPQNRHCSGCHFPLQDDGCAVCHRSSPSHQLATPLPASHTPGMNCRQCHGNGQPLPHPDGGHPCSLCHR